MNHVRLGSSPAKRILLLAIGAWAMSANAAPAIDPTTLQGKVLFGYQGWFSCPAGGGSSGWFHWTKGGAPTPTNLKVDMFPDLSEIKTPDLCPAGSLTIGGKQAYVFSSKNAAVVETHFRWMEEYGLDGVFVQRFIGSTQGNRSSGDQVLKNVMASAAAHGRTFAIEYDLTGGDEGNFAQMIQDDWKYMVDNLKATSHPNYLHHNGKPVVSVWGPGLNDGKHIPASGTTLQSFIGWFHSGPEAYRAFYMGGTPAGWATGNGDAKSGSDWQEAYKAMDAIQPWTVGRYSDTNGVKNWARDKIAPDLAKTKANGDVYMPVIFPGFSWANMTGNNRPNQIPRIGGKFLWSQAYNAKAAGATMLKIAMFDEVDEGTAMFKLAPARNLAPDQGYWLTLDADGYKLPSDWYLRMAREVTAMFHGSRAVSAAMPLDPAHPGVAIGRAGGNAAARPLFRPMEGGFLIQAGGWASDFRIYSPAGEQLRRLAMPGGRGFWDGRDGKGNPVSSGAYLVRVDGHRTGAVSFRVVLP